MANKIRSLLNSAGFYAALGLCVLVAAVGGYFLLFDSPAAPVSQPAESPRTETAAPVPESIAPPVVETVEPAEVEVETPPVTMPEVFVPDDVPVAAEAPRLVVSPLNGQIVAAFSVDQLVYNETLEDWRTHDGIDIAAQAGTTVLSASSGTVLSVEDDALMGTTVVVGHDGGYQTTYANLQARPTVEVGDTVSAGQILGAVGTTAAAEAAQGPHLHFSVTRNGDAVDPDTFLRG